MWRLEEQRRPGETAEGIVRKGTEQVADDSEHSEWKWAESSGITRELDRAG
jgi:hypothetical protein